MAFTHTLQRNWVGNGTSKNSSVNYSGDSQVSLETTVADGQTDQQEVIAFSVASNKLQSVFIISDQAITVEFNSTAGSGGAVTLVANVPYIWHTGSYFTNLITADVTTTYWTNASGSTANIRLEAVYN